jgi:hypothetical protein
VPNRSPFLATYLETRPTPLPVIASGGDRGKHPCGGSPTTIAASCHPIKHGRMPPPVGHHHQSGGSLLYAGACLGLLLCHDVGLCSKIVVGLSLLQMQWPSSCRSSSLPRRGSWIAGEVSSQCGRMDWQSLSMPLESCAQNMTPVTSELRLSNRTYLPRRTSLVPGPDSSSTPTGCWRNAISFFAYRR